MNWDEARVEVKREFEGSHAFDHSHVVNTSIGWFLAGLKCTRFDEAEYIHAKLFEILWKDKLARGMRARKVLAILNTCQSLC